MDVDMIQGFYFSRPHRHDQMEYGPVLERIDGLGGAFKKNFIRKIGVKRFNMNRYYGTLMEIQMELGQTPPEGFDLILKRMAGDFPSVESLYLLDETGLQVSESVLNDAGGNKRNAVLFRPSSRGA